jgi:hypothetical protein
MHFAPPKLPVYLQALLIFGIFLAFMAGIQFSTPDMPDNDGFYHIKLAAIMREQGLKPAFPWLPLSILNPAEYYDHHFLFHVALMPFTFGDLRLGAKWAAAIFSSLAFMAVWWLLRGQRVRYSALWALGLLAVSEAFLYRMSVTRAQSLSLGILALGLHWLFTGKNRHLAVLAFIYVWTYDAFPLLPVLGVIYTFSLWLVDRRLDLRPLAYIMIGTALGLVINLYFPQNLVFIYHHLLPKLTDATSTRVGNEWFPYDTGQLLENSPLALAAFVAGALALGLSGRKMNTATTTAFLAAALFGYMLFQARRFVEYFPPFGLIFAALAWSPLFEPGESAPDGLPDSRFSVILNRLAPVVLSLILLAGMVLTYEGAQASIGRSKPYDLYAGASHWLENHTKSGERVFQTDWDDFPRLFFYNASNTYLIGLDPTYMQLYDAALYDQWVSITQGKVENPSQIILRDYGARYVISDLDHGAFLRSAEADSQMHEVYRDEQAAIYEIFENK